MRGRRCISRHWRSVTFPWPMKVNRRTVNVLPPMSFPAKSFSR
jgi:hypothetical protein